MTAKTIWPARAGLLLAVLLLLALAAFVGDRFTREPPSPEPPAAMPAAAPFQGKLTAVEIGLIATGDDTPRDLAVDAATNLSVAAGRAVLVLAPAGRVVRSWTAPGLLQAVCVSPDGRIFAATPSQVLEFDRGQAEPRAWSETGTADGAFQLITDLAATETDLLVADAGHRAVYRYGPDGRLAAVLGRKDAERGAPGLVLPSPHLDVAADDRGYVYLNNPGRFQVEKYDEAGRLVSSWGKWGNGPDGFPGCCNPVNLALISQDLFAVAVKDEPVVKVFDGNGNLLALLGADVLREVDDMDLAVDSAGRILVLDQHRRLIRVYRLEPTAP
jgi:hypothetical protein